jgi:sugar phosphate isomerase/epimerase
MKHLLLCDDGEIESVSEKSRGKNFGIEIQAFYKPSRCRDDKEIEKHRKLIHEISPVSIHGPFGDLCPGSFDSMVRDVAMNRFNLGYSVATKLDIDHIVFHIGWVPGAGSRTNWAKRCIDFWKEFLEGKSEKTNFYIENLFDKSPALIKDVIKGINNDRVKVCLDLGHVHSYSDVGILGWVKELGKNIGYLHIHDNNGEEDEHLGINMGTIQMETVLNDINKVNPSTIWALEMYPKYLEDSILWLEERGFI